MFYNLPSTHEPSGNTFPSVGCQPRRQPAARPPGNAHHQVGYKRTREFSYEHQFSNYSLQIIIIMKVVSVLLKAYFLSASSSSCNSVVFSKLNFNHFQSFEIGRCSLCPHCRGFCQLQQPWRRWCQLLPRTLRCLQKSLWSCLC